MSLLSARTSKASNTKLGNCDVCEKQTAKYTCPACEIHTCSLKCITDHKVETDCDGIRSKTSYVPLTKMNDFHLLNDYRLLEEVGRNVDKYAKDKTKRYSRFDQSLPIHLHRLLKAVMHRGTRFYFLPQHFSRHQNNTTFLNWKTKQISWKIQLTFLNAEMLTYHEDRCPENLSLEDILSPYIRSSCAPKALKPYQKAGMESIDVLMKAEKLNQTSNKFYKLNLKMSMKDNLYGKSVVEYPQLFVLIQDFYSSKSDAELETEKLEAKNSKVTDFLQLKEGEHQDDDIADDSSSEEEMSEEIDSSLDSPLTSVLPSYMDLIKN